MASASDKVVPQGGVTAETGGYQSQHLGVPPAYPQHVSTSYPHPPAPQDHTHPPPPPPHPHPPYQHTTQYPYPPVAPQQPPEPAPTFQPDQVTVVPFHASLNTLTKSTSLAVILCVPILGLLGMHHFYLNRTFFGAIYSFTFGLFGLGWVIDWFRIGGLVRKCNQDNREDQIRGYQLISPKFPFPLRKISLCDAYMLWLPPVGLFGLYQYYLGRTRYGIYHTCTLGSLGIGWLLDFCRLPSMVRKANADIAMMKKGIRVEDPPYSVCDAYSLAFPLGIFGLHHFYLGNTRRGILFLCTAGVFGLGWLADLCQMPLIVAEANKNRELKKRLLNAEANNVGHSIHTTVVVSTPNSGYTTGPSDPHEQGMMGGGAVGGATGGASEPPPVYRPVAGEGESVMDVANDPMIINKDMKD